MKGQPFSNQEGFGILEVLIALTIFAVAVLALAQLQIGAMKGNTTSRQLTEASYLAQNKLEQLVSLPFPSLVDDGAGSLNSTGADADGTETTSVLGATYQISWNVDDNNPEADMKMLQVIVTWREGAATKELSLSRVHCHSNI
ncbi:MAG: prepilin-type N-terminal cleavage/methylation domain-containing protein [Desulfuromonadaceae bacterium]|nr:prepilin-type N-terminal cleavage/methylation domain-containing protein [Desulfuromonadaceae bacterium]